MKLWPKVRLCEVLKLIDSPCRVGTAMPEKVNLQVVFSFGRGAYSNADQCLRLGQAIKDKSSG